MNDNVVQFPTQPKQGEKTFFMCACNPEQPHPFVPVVLYQNPPVVVGLLCPNCRQHLDLVNGVVQAPPRANGA